MWLSWEFELIKKISCMTQINMSSRWTARIKVEDRDACFKRLCKRRLGGAKKPIRVKGQRSYSHGELYVEECHYSSERRWLVNQDGIHSYANWRFKITSSKRVCSKNEDVDALTDWSKKGRLNHNAKLKWELWLLYISFMHLSIGMPYYQGGCNVNGFRQHQKCSK